MECPVDMDRINEFTSGDPEQFKELTDLYLSQTTEQLQSLQEAINAGDAKKVEQVAHKCAGSSATCGMVIISPILRDLENKARAGDISEAPAQFAKIVVEYERIKAFLAEVQSSQ